MQYLLYRLFFEYITFAKKQRTQRELYLFFFLSIIPDDIFPFQKLFPFMQKKEREWCFAIFFRFLPLISCNIVSGERTFSSFGPVIYTILSELLQGLTQITPENKRVNYRREGYNARGGITFFYANDPASHFFLVVVARVLYFILIPRKWICFADDDNEMTKVRADTPKNYTIHGRN